MSERHAWIALRADGTKTRHVSRDAARRASSRSTGPRTVVEICREDEMLPDYNDAAGWDAYRLRHGISGPHS